MRDFIGSHPYWYYADVDLANVGGSLGPQRIIRQIKDGYDYLLQGFLISIAPDSDLDDIGPDLYIQVVQGERGRELHEDPVPVSLLSTPGMPGYTYRARPLTYFVRYNYLFSTRSILECVITGQAGREPESCRVVIAGRNIKRKISDDN